MFKRIRALLRGIDGERTVSPKQLRRPATDFRDPTTFEVSTGKKEGQWLGKLLISLSAKGGAWYLVPWRMLRNEYMKYSKRDRVLRCMWLKPPALPTKEHLSVIDVTLGNESSLLLELLLIGLKDLLDNGMVDQITMVNGETYYRPTEKLLSCVYDPRRQPSNRDLN